jgi:hypothetical protein
MYVNDGGRDAPLDGESAGTRIIAWSVVAVVVIVATIVLALRFT